MKYYLQFICNEHGEISGTSINISTFVEYATKQYNDKLRIEATCKRCGAECILDLYEVIEK